MLHSLSLKNSSNQNVWCNSSAPQAVFDSKFVHSLSSWSNNNHDRATVHRTRSSGIIVVGYYRRLFPSASVKTLGYSMLICTFQFKYVMFGWQVAFLSWSPQTIVDRESASSSESCNKIERANNLSINSMITGKKRSIEIKMKMCESQSLRSHIFRGRVFTKRHKTSLPGSSLFLSR